MHDSENLGPEPDASGVPHRDASQSNAPQVKELRSEELGSEALRKKIAIALFCDPEAGMEPKVTTTARGYMAKQLLQLAEEHGVPVESSPPLVESLSALAPGQSVPEAFFPLLASVMIHVDSIREKFIAAGPSSSE